MTYEEFHEVLRRYNWSVKQFAEKVGYNPTSIYSWKKYRVPRWGEAFIAMMVENDRQRQKIKALDGILESWYSTLTGIQHYKSKEIIRD